MSNLKYYVLAISTSVSFVLVAYTNVKQTDQINAIKADLAQVELQSTTRDCFLLANLVAATSQDQERAAGINAACNQAAQEQFQKRVNPEGTPNANVSVPVPSVPTRANPPREEHSI